MKRVFCILTVLVILVASAAPALAADLQGGYYFVADCSLGSGVKFYVPAEYATGSLTYDSSGYLFNLTGSTIYLYCPDYPNISISASRFSGFQYRQNNVYDYIQLNARNIKDTNVEIYDSSPAAAPGSPELLVIIVVLLLVLIGCFVIVRR